MPSNTTLNGDEPSYGIKDDTATMTATAASADRPRTEYEFAVTLAPNDHDGTFEWNIKILGSTNVPAEYTAIVRSTVEDFVYKQWTASPISTTGTLLNAKWVWNDSRVRVSECIQAWSNAKSSHPAATQEIAARRREWKEADRAWCHAEDQLTLAFESQLRQRTTDYVNNYLTTALAAKETDQLSVPKIFVYFGF